MEFARQAQGRAKNCKASADKDSRFPTVGLAASRPMLARVAICEARLQNMQGF